MSEGSPARERLEDYVEVLLDYQYEDRGHTYAISKGETLMVLKRPNSAWWQVIREGSYRAFYAPAQHLQHKYLSEKEMKRIISGNSTKNENVAFARRSHEFESRGGAAYPPPGFPSSNTSQTIQAYPGHLMTPPLPASALSVSEGSAESLKHHPRKPVIKARSIDELRSGERCHSTLDITKIRQASSEELDRRSSGSLQLSPRLRSSSFDLRMAPKDTEMKVWSLDKPRNSRISKDQWDRRRSWALENFRPSLKRGETVDAAIVLDVPPELPPKTKPKRGLNTFNSNPENIGHLEGPVDLKVEQVRMGKSGQLFSGSEQHTGVETEMRHSRHSSDPLLLLEAKNNCPLYHETHNGKDPPVALPRKLLPPQVAPMEDKFEILSIGGDHTPRDANGNKVKKSSSQTSIVSLPSSIDEGSSKGRDPLGSFRFRGKISESYNTGKISTSPEVFVKSDSSSLPSQKSKSDPPKAQTVKSKISQSFGSFRKNSRREAKKEDKEKEQPVRDTSTPDSLRAAGKIMQSPPSPLCPPQRTLSGDWGEYFDQTSKRPYYYNCNTREKRWKPPRKGLPSTSIPEVKVPCAVTEDNSSRGNAPQCPPPKCPTPDYPTSPRLSHKPFSYTATSDTPQLHPIITRAATLNSSPTTTIPSQAFTTPITPTTPTTPTSRTISTSHKPSKQKMLPLALSSTPPSVPPSSAKPTFPTTPTTPEFMDFTATTTTTTTTATATTEDQNNALLDILYKMELPQGWEKKYDAFNQRIYFYNRVTRERWLATTSDEGKVYYYEESGTKSAWTLPEVDEADLRDKEAYPSQALPSPIENYRLSNITENLSELSENIMRDGFLHRTFLMRDGKKVRKNWTQSYTRFIVHSFNCGCSGILYFTKTRDDEKKPEFFEFYPPCYLEHASDKKTSRQQVLALRNGHDTEILLQFEEREIAQEWFKLLNSHEGVIYNVNMAEDKKMKKVKRETSMEQLSPDSKGIKDKLRNFIKRRPLKETLENKGIYKESVFGSTLAELKSQDKTTIPIFVLRCIQSIEKDDENLRTDGLYRISGNAAQIQKIRFEIAQRKYNVLSEEKEIHNLSGALKLFFRELKEPLIPFDNYEDFIRATGSEYRRMNQQSDKLTKAINRLPIENRDTLKVLMQHLLRVSEYESENRMSLFNLAIVFGPCLMWPKVTLSHDLMTDVMLHNRVVEGLLSDFSRVFSKR